MKTDDEQFEIKIKKQLEKLEKSENYWLSCKEETEQKYERLKKDKPLIDEQQIKKYLEEALQTPLYQLTLIKEYRKQLEERDLTAVFNWGEFEYRWYRDMYKDHYEGEDWRRIEREQRQAKREEENRKIKMKQEKKRHAKIEFLNVDDPEEKLKRAISWEIKEQEVHIKDYEGRKELLFKENKENGRPSNFGINQEEKTYKRL